MLTLAGIPNHRCLKPGGWVEFQDWASLIKSDDGSSEGTGVETYLLQVNVAFEKGGYVTLPALGLEERLKEAGFVNVHTEKFIIPLGTWAKGEQNVSFVINWS
jgi:hypothetical protein